MKEVWKTFVDMIMRNLRIVTVVCLVFTPIGAVISAFGWPFSVAAFVLAWLCEKQWEKAHGSPDKPEGA